MCPRLRPASRWSGAQGAAVHQTNTLVLLPGGFRAETKEGVQACQQGRKSQDLDDCGAERLDGGRSREAVRHLALDVLRLAQANRPWPLSPRDQHARRRLFQRRGSAGRIEIGSPWYPSRGNRPRVGNTVPAPRAAAARPASEAVTAFGIATRIIHRPRCAALCPASHVAAGLRGLLHFRLTNAAGFVAHGGARFERAKARPPHGRPIGDDDVFSAWPLR